MAATRVSAGTAAPDPGIRRRAILALVAGVAVILETAVLADAGGVLLVCAYGIPGLVLAVRRPGQPIAWLLLLMAIGLALGTSRVTATLDDLMAGTLSPLEAFTAWANGVGWVLVFLGLIGIALVFPSGRMPTGTWRRVGVLAVAVALLIAALLALGPIINVTFPGAPSGVDIPNPYALPFLADSTTMIAATVPLWLALFAVTGVAGGALVARFRASSGQERLQYRWLAWALLLVGTGSLAWAVVTNLLRDAGLLPAVIVAVTYPTIPIAIVIAVLRYRLYEIDRLVSRTLGWGLATASVGTVFVAGVLALQTLLAGVTQGQTLAVAGSTLLACVAFQPIRSRVQAAVDRRFDRPRLAAERSLAAFGERLQHEVDLEALARDVELTVLDTLRPAAAGLWIRGT
jgi:hypothetical protein